MQALLRFLVSQTEPKLDVLASDAWPLDTDINESEIILKIFYFSVNQNLYHIVELTKKLL
jgi:hypothetical protein